MKRIVTEWLEGGHLVCQRGTHRGQVLYEVIAEKACERIYNAISARLGSERRVLAVTDPYNVEGSTADVSYRTAKTTLWRTDEQKCHVNWAGLRPLLGDGVLPGGRSGTAGRGVREERRSRVRGPLPVRRGVAPVPAGLHRPRPGRSGPAGSTSSSRSKASRTSSRRRSRRRCAASGFRA